MQKGEYFHQTIVMSKLRHMVSTCKISIIIYKQYKINSRNQNYLKAHIVIAECSISCILFLGESTWQIKLTERSFFFFFPPRYKTCHKVRVYTQGNIPYHLHLKYFAILIDTYNADLNNTTKLLKHFLYQRKMLSLVSVLESFQGILILEQMLIHIWKFMITQFFEIHLTL